MLPALAAPLSAPGASPCDRAKALYDAGYYADAEKEYKRLLGVATCATPRLAERAHEQAATTAAGQLATARRLQDAGFQDDARKIVKSVAETSDTPIPRELRAVDQRSGWWQAQLARVGPPLRVGAEMLAVVLGALALVLVAFSLGRALVLRMVRSARLTGFTGCDEEVLGPVLTAGLGAALARMGDQKATSQIRWQSGTEPKFDLPAAVADIVPQAGLLTGLVHMVDRLLYRRIYLVSGTVHPVHEGRGAGITLVVSAQGRTVDQVTIWEKDFMLKVAGAGASDAVRYERLVLPAAIWLGYRPALGFDPADPPLKTTDWRSYALSALGELAPGPSSRVLYERALDLDSRNLGARLNLGTFLLQRPRTDVPPPSGGPDDGRRETWQERRDEAGRHLEYVTANTSRASDAVWYRARYLQAVRHIYDEQGREAWACLHEVSEGKRLYGRDPRLRDLLSALEGPVTVAHLTAQLIVENEVPDVPDLREDWLSAAGEYNLAGLWARASLVDPAQAKARTRAAITALRRSRARSDHALEEARRDPAFDAIREQAAFKELVPAQAADAEEPAEPSRHAVTVDPGPELLKFVGDRLSRR